MYKIGDRVEIVNTQTKYKNQIGKVSKKCFNYYAILLEKETNFKKTLHVKKKHIELVERIEQL